VQLVIADTGPVNYLLLIGHIDILPALFDKVILPSVVKDELADPKAPIPVQNWIANTPAWVEVRSSTGSLDDEYLSRLDAGEEAAIVLAVELHVDLLLMDDREGVIAARRKGFRVAGTLAVLSMAAQRDLLNLTEAFERLKRTSFHYRQKSWISFSTNSPAGRSPIWS
jgi:predicted nucleic acid-binding protein